MKLLPNCALLTVLMPALLHCSQASVIQRSRLCAEALAGGVCDLAQVRSLLLDEGVSVNQRDDHGRTALHWACALNMREIIEKLRARGACLDMQDNYGKTPWELSFNELKKEYRDTIGTNLCLNVLSQYYHLWLTQDFLKKKVTVLLGLHPRCGAVSAIWRARSIEGNSALVRVIFAYLSSTIEKPWVCLWF